MDSAKIAGPGEDPSVEMLRNFPGEDRRRMPDPVIRVTAGAGGEALLIAGSSKTALVDTGMAYCAGQLIRNIRSCLGETGRTLDYILLSHTHYDHIGALPLLLEEWPDAAVCGAAHCARVFASPGAREKMQELGLIAWERYAGHAPETLPMDRLRLDRVLEDDETLSLGEERIRALVTRGHTDCSMSYALEPAGILFTSESTGVLESPSRIHTPILKSYRDAMDSLEKCRRYPARVLISPHYGVVPGYFIEKYWSLFQQGAEEKRAFLRELYRPEMSPRELLEAYTRRYWSDGRSAEQPKEAFLENAGNIIRALLTDILAEGRAPLPDAAADGAAPSAPKSEERPE